MKKRVVVIAATMILTLAVFTTATFAGIMEGKFMLSAALLQGGSQPTWPQRFDFASGGRVSFVIPVTQPGQLTVRVTWNGGPLSVQLMDPAGNTVDSASPGPSPVVRNLTVTRAQADAALFVVKIVSSEAGDKNRYVGEVNVQAPPLDPARLALVVNTTKNSIAPLQAQAKSAMEQQRNADRPLSEKAGTDRIAELRSKIQNRIRTFQKTPGITNPIIKTEYKMQSNSNPTTGLGNQVAKRPAFAAPSKLIAGNAGMLKAGNLQPDLVPTLDSIAPQYARTDADLKITGTNLVRLDKWSEAEVKQKCTVLFSITPDITIEVPVAAAQQISNTATQLTVKVPPAQILDVTGIYIRIKTTAWSAPQITDPQSITYDPFSPVIESVSPAAAYPNETITIRGRNFLNTTTVNVSLAGGNILPAAIVSRTANEIKMKVPSNPYAVTTYKGLLQCKTQWATAPGYGNTADFTFLIPPTITQAFPANGEPRDPILLIGNNFKAPAKVHFKEQVHNNETVVPAVFDSSELVEAAIPDFGAIPLSGFQGMVAVESDGILGPWVPFKFDPHIAEVYIDTIQCIGCSMQKNPDNRYWGSYHGDFWWGHSGYDYYTANMQNLKNGWTIVGMEFNNGGYRGEARLEGNPGITNGVGNATIRWWADCFMGNAWYSIGFKIKGPSGLPYR
jgi:hypothetical protein